DTLAHVLDREPDWRALPSSTPARIRELVRRCLEKDPNRRVGDVAFVRREIEICLASPFKVPKALLDSIRFGLCRPVVRWAMALSALGAAGALIYSARDTPAPLPRLTNPIQVTREAGVEDYPTLSPDARTVAFESNQTGNWD